METFLLEKSPWWGGFYERIIGIIINRCFKKVVALLNYRELTTFLTEIEQTLKSRLMTYFHLIYFMEETSKRKKFLLIKSKFFSFQPISKFYMEKKIQNIGLKKVTTTRTLSHLKF